jgi:hypothetical protein
VVVGGLRGRLIATPFRDARHHAQLELGLELENVGDQAEPITIATMNPSSIVELVLEDADGKPLEQEHPPGNEISLPPYALRIPVSSVLRMRLSAAAYEHQPSGVTLLRPFTFQAWKIPSEHGPLFLRGTIKPVRSDVAGPHAWKGPLMLPRVALP